MQNIKNILVFAFLILIRATCLAQACDDCSHPRVALYDCIVDIPRPVDEPDSILAWQTLFWPSAAARGFIRSDDPRRECIVWIDGAMVNALDLQRGKIKLGPEHANLPAAGPLNSSDYIITSKVQPAGNKYLFFLVLETAVSREIVKRVELEFSADVESANHIGKQAAMQMMPLFETIRNFEVNKRNTDIRVGINDLESEIIAIKPEKNLVKTGETINVDISMIDCDGVPLTNRRIIFVDTAVQINNDIPELKGTIGGEITPRVAVTDESGKVTVKFRAGNKADLGQIVAWYPHLKPCGRGDAFHGVANVQINPLPPKFWVLNARITSTSTLKRDTVMTFDMGGMQEVNQSSARVQTKSSGTIFAAIENLSEEPGKAFHYFSDEAEPLAILITAQGFHDEFSTRRETIDGKLYRASTRNDNVHGNEVSKVDIQFDYSPDYKFIGLGFTINAVGSYIEHQFSGEWSDYRNDIDSYSIWCTGGGDATNKDCKITKNDSGYFFSWTFKKNEQINSSNGTEFITTEGTLSGTLTPAKDYIKK